jgi:hypothetical protein
MPHILLHEEQPWGVQYIQLGHSQFFIWYLISQIGIQMSDDKKLG